MKEFAALRLALANLYTVCLAALAEQLRLEAILRWLNRIITRGERC